MSLRCKATDLARRLIDVHLGDSAKRSALQGSAAAVYEDPSAAQSVGIVVQLEERVKQAFQERRFRDLADEYYGQELKYLEKK